MATRVGNCSIWATCLAPTGARCRSCLVNGLAEQPESWFANRVVAVATL